MLACEDCLNNNELTGFGVLWVVGICHTKDTGDENTVARVLAQSSW